MPIVDCNSKSLLSCYQQLKASNLVAFPTETVYGLGANALDITAVEKVFAIKKRPKFDPLIVHIARYTDCLPLTDMTILQKDCLTVLAEKFWPGPLTIIVKRSNLIPNIITAQTNYVGLRIPNHPVALQLLNLCDFPIAAPSANLFGHISPTSAQHVYQDFPQREDLLILDSDIPCTIGIESTIIKISDNNEIFLLRPGAISSIAIEQELHKKNLNLKLQKPDVIKKHTSFTNQAPGQSLKHYSPYIESFIYQGDILTKEMLAEIVFIDFNQKYKSLCTEVLAYFELSACGNYTKASANIFAMLRKAESIAKAKYILLPDFTVVQDEIGQALFDRIYRATSGKYI